MSSRFFGTVECYDCHKQVPNLKEHRSQCLNSRQNKNLVKQKTTEETETSEKKTNFTNSTDRYLLIDASGSMTGTRIANVKTVINDVFPTFHKNDRIAIVTFDDAPYFRLKPRPVGQIRRQNELPNILSRIKTLNNTAIYDAIYVTVEQIFDKSRKTAITVITDGEDYTSRHTLEQLLNLLKEYPNITLDIIHVSDVPLEPYQQICSNRGEYLIITEVEITVKYKSMILMRL